MTPLQAECARRAKAMGHSDAFDAFAYYSHVASRRAESRYEPPRSKVGVVISKRTGQLTKILKDVIWKDSKC